VAGPEGDEKRGYELGKSRQRGVRSVNGGGSNRVRIVIGLIVLAFIAGFIALIVVDRSQRAAKDPPSGVEQVDVGPAGKHTEGTVNYAQDPPAGGEHNPVWQNQGFYEEQVRNENAVHTLEHGGVWITYRPDLPQDQKDKLRSMVEGQDCLIASPYPSLPESTPIVASAWGAQMRFKDADDPDLQQFIQYYRKGPQTPEPRAACTGGIGSPS
jgi:hypothetical protein